MLTTRVGMPNDCSFSRACAIRPTSLPLDISTAFAFAAPPSASAKTQAAAQDHAVHEAWHAVLAEAEEEQPPALFLGAEIVRRQRLRAAARRELGRAADELGDLLEDRVEHGVRRGAAGDAAVVLREV